LGGEAATECRGQSGAARIDVDQLNLCTGQPRRERGDEGADDAGTDDRYPVSWTRHTVPKAVYRCLHVGGERRAPIGHVVRNDDDGFLGHDEPVLMGMETEYAATAEFGGTILDNAGHGIAIFHRCREPALLERTTHPLPFALRHLAAKHERFGASADAAGAGMYQQLARCQRTQSLCLELAAARRRDPKRSRLNHRRNNPARRGVSGAGAC